MWFLADEQGYGLAAVSFMSTLSVELSARMASGAKVAVTAVVSMRFRRLERAVAVSLSVSLADIESPFLFELAVRSGLKWVIESDSPA